MPENSSLALFTKFLESLFTAYNAYLFGGKLEQVVITASPRHQHKALAWFTCWRAWQEDGGEGYYEINLCAEFLNLPFLDICELLLHEMIHLYNQMQNIQDASRSGLYHNNRYRVAAVEHGLCCSRSEKYGWSNTSLSAQTVAWLQTTYGSNPSPFPLYRDPGGVPKKPGKPETESNASRTSGLCELVCPSCGLIVYAPTDANISCDDCHVALQLHEKKRKRTRSGHTGAGHK